MDLKKIDKETAIKLILSELKKGISKASILQHLSENYKNSEKTFYNYYSAAEILYKDFLSKVNPIIEAKEIEAIGELAKAGILTKLERQKILSDIALGNIPIRKEVLSKFGVETIENEPTAADRINAIDKLNKMDGSYLEGIDKDDEFKGFEIDEV